MPHVSQQAADYCGPQGHKQEAIRKLCQRNQCQIVRRCGQRLYGPPKNWTDPAPDRGSEVFVGKIPRDCFEDELVPIMEQVGVVYQFRLMIEFSGNNRGYGFCVFGSAAKAKLAAQQLDGVEIRPRHSIGVKLSFDNCRLYIGNLPRCKTQPQVLAMMRAVSDNVQDVVLYNSAHDTSINRGFAFVEYSDHRAAAMARRRLIPYGLQLWDRDIVVDWADPEVNVDSRILDQSKALHVRNVQKGTSEQKLRELFELAAAANVDSDTAAVQQQQQRQVDCVVRVKKIRDFAFVHFTSRQFMISALSAMNGAEVDGRQLEVSIAKPLSEAQRLKRLYRRQQKLQQQQQQPSPAQPLLSRSPNDSCSGQDALCDDQSIVEHSTHSIVHTQPQAINVSMQQHMTYYTYHTSSTTSVVATSAATPTAPSHLSANWCLQLQLQQQQQLQQHQQQQQFMQETWNNSGRVNSVPLMMLASMPSYF